MNSGLTTHPTYQQPQLVRGFEHIQRYWDKHLNCWAAKILPGEFYVTKGKEMIATVLGSCISVCIRDPKAGVAGMNHFMLPSSGEFSTIDWGCSSVSSATRYGNWAMEYMINAIMKEGGRKERFEVKVFGGGQVLANLTDIGQRNILFVLSYLKQEGLETSAVDVGNIYPRKVLYMAWEGKVRVKKLASQHNQTIVRRERDYLDQIRHRDEQSDIELFE
ncbi:chemoreceptor glutamine deamidase CheD [Gynuella sunshinyii]|uniref:Probable chemoreceptor glutamine deamidase CheD n=1 Tax=Gynuella sunshinyii YC6258 TaxID=1445510 RepID=A0A0C5VQ14_9GAMM|nr:chemoreceptor glutamine deamidase CheD [Gynuella sunshinyii]AJQ96326.1 chemotaxis protein [Gynuella sunshinyii YC6258]